MPAKRAAKSKNNQEVNGIQEYLNERMRNDIKIEAFITKQLITEVKNTINIYCPVCGSDNVSVSEKQTRSADEATTKIFHCLNCGNLDRKFLKGNDSAEFKKKIKDLQDSFNKKK